MSGAKKSAASAEPPQLDRSFEQLLLQLSAAAAQGCDFAALVRLFCRATREFFDCSGVFCWKLLPSGELFGFHGDGYVADRFAGTRLKPSDTSAAVQAVQTRRTIYRNAGDTPRFHEDFPVLSVLSAPLIAAGEITGAVTLVHVSEPRFFHDGMAEKTTILAGLLAGFMEASRLTRQSRDERRRSELLVQCAEVLHSHTDVESVLIALAERVREILSAQIVVALLRSGDKMGLRAVAATTPELAEAVRARAATGGCVLAGEIAERAVQAGGPVVTTIDPARNDLPEYLTTGQILAAPIRSPGSSGALLVYGGPECVFSQDSKELVGAVAGLGSVALTDAELYATASARARELQQLLDISAELGSIGELDRFLEKFVVRAAEFLGFRRSLIALCEAGKCQVCWVAELGSARPLKIDLPEAVVQRVHSSREPFWSDDGSPLSATQLVVGSFPVKQYLSVPLAGSDGRIMGLFAVLDRKDAAAVSPEDVRRASALGAEVAVVLEATQNLDLSQQHRRRAESLMNAALDLNSSLRLPEFVRKFTQRAADILGARLAGLALAQRAQLEIVSLQEPALQQDRSLVRRLNAALSDVVARHLQPIVSGPAEELLGKNLATMLGWHDLAFVRLTGADDELMGLLCLVDRGQELTAEHQTLLQALAGHATVALENSRLFTRMDQANRHWVEIFDSITDFIVVHDESNKVLRVNRSLADFIGVRPSELIGVSMRALVSMAAQPGPQPCPFCRVGVGTSDEYIHPVLERTYLVSTSRLNEGVQTIHVLKDITDRREAERRYRELFDNIQEGLFFSTPEGRFIEVNDALVRMLGYNTRDELLQADIPSELYLSPEQRQPFRSAIEGKGALRNFQEVLRRKDGALIHTLQNAFAVRDSQGKVVQYRGLILDITELKNFQAELQRERDFNSKVLNNTQSLILVADTAGLISYANRRCYEAGGYGNADLLGKKLVELIPTPRQHAMAEALESTLGGHQVDNLDLPVLLGGGRIGQFSINLSPMRDEQGNVNAIVVVMTDITDAAMLQAKLMHTEKMAAVGQLVSGVAHEVNNPLTAILGFSDLLLEEPNVPETAKKDLRVIIQEAQRTKQIVQNLLSFARQMPPQRKPVQLNSILRRTLALRAYDFANHGVEVVERFDDRLPDVVGDSHQLQQVFLNILNNAYDAVRDAGRPGRIEITTAVRDRSAEISFRDNGQGIVFPDRIFDPFFTTKEVGKGTGLGLSICYGIIHEHGGEISCCNNTTQEGATFTVRLPFASETAALSAAAGVP